MDELDPTLAFTDDLCLECGYRRRGLSAATACPECGAVPDAAAIHLRGASDAAPPWVAMLVGSISLLCLLAFMFFFVRHLAWGRGSSPNIGVTWSIMLGLVFGVRGLRRWRMRERGGDVVWALGPDGLGVRVGKVWTMVAAGDFPRYKVEREKRSKRTRVSLRPKGLWNSLSSHRIWAVPGDPAIERLLAALRERGVTVPP